MQDNQNFERIMNKWRRISAVEQADKGTASFVSMSGDSSNHDTLLKKKDEESALIFPEHSGHNTLAVASAGAAVAATELPPSLVSTNVDEKQEFIKRDREDEKGASGDVDNKKQDENIENKSQTDKEVMTEKEKLGDNVDSVVLRSPLPRKAHSNTSTPQEQEEDCGIKCLYYTLECCDCVLM